MERIFELDGRVCAADGVAISNVIVAVVDRDVLRDDLLGVGRTDEKGRFRLSFTQGEFNQEWLERETEPDIYVVLSVYLEEYFEDIDTSGEQSSTLTAVAVLEFPDLEFDDGPTSLGDIKVEDWHDEPPLLPGQTPIPGQGKRALRLRVNDDLVRYCLAEVAPRVQRLTRWPGLTDGLEIHVSRDMSDYVEQMFAQADLESDAVTRRLVQGVIKRRVLALYDPLLDAIFVNAGALRHCNLDGLKVVLGHELVHVGQFRKSARHRLEYEERTRALLELNLDDMTIEELMEAMSNLGLQRQMEDLEGYAYYIQTDFLERHYNCSMISQQTSLFDRLLAFALRRFGIAEDLKKMGRIKQDQYEQGRQRYRKRQKREAPARFG